MSNRDIAIASLVIDTLILLVLILDVCLYSTK